MLLRYGGFNYRTGGDLPTNAEEPLGTALNLDNITVVILRVSHYGADTSSSNHYLFTIQPDFGVISAGTGNGEYHHPRQSTLDHRHTEA
ncbi:MAG: hypothetical protein WCP22_01875 [Chlamydiota bacterium]